MIGKTLNHYRILEKIGEGGMGEVYLAHDTDLDRKVALKFLPLEFASEAEALARFKREAQAAAALNHPNIITIYEVSEHEGRPYIAMAYIEGRNLTDVIASELPFDRAIDIAVQICEGLHKAHQAKIVHRDIKPANVTIDGDGRAKILDFGLAMSGGATRLTREDSTLGTLSYMSPEQARGADVDHRSDIFSLGAVLYEMIAGRPAFKGEHAAAIHYLIANKDPEPVSRYSTRATPELERILAKALAKDPDARYQSAADFAADLKLLRAAPATTRAKDRKNLKRVLIPGAAALVAVVLFFVFKPFGIDIRPDQPVEAAENKLTIMYFENLVDPSDSQRLGEIMTDLLIANLSQTGHVKVVSSQRLYDILKLQGKEGAKVVDRTTATAVAEHAGARWMMQGRILQVVPHLVVTSQLVEVSTGDVESAQRIEGAPGESIFSVVDRMTAETRADLPVPAGVIDTPEPVSIANVTTHSVEAYRYYLEGLEYERKVYRKEASDSYRKAIDIDSTFAMAHMRLAWNLLGHEGMAHLRKAVEYSDRATKKEQLYIQGTMAWWSMNTEVAVEAFEAIIALYPDEKDAHMYLGGYYRRSGGDLASAAEHFLKVVEIDPMDKLAYNALSYTYAELGESEKSLWAINQYIALAPEEPNPYDSRGDLHAYAGHVGKAIESYEAAIALDPRFFGSIVKLGHMHLFRGEYEKAEAEYRKLIVCDDPVERARGRRAMAFVPLRQGKLVEAIDRLEAAVSADELEDYSGGQYVATLRTLSWVCAELEERERAIALEEDASDARIGGTPSSLHRLAEMERVYSWIRCGALRRAEAYLDSVGTGVDQLDSMSRSLYFRYKGFLALRHGEYARAIEVLLPEETGVGSNFATRYHLGRAYLRLENFEEAIRFFERILNRYDEDRAERVLSSVKSQYLLGVSYEGAGRKEEAIKQYETFLGIWKDADPRLKELGEARERLRALRKSS